MSLDRKEIFEKLGKELEKFTDKAVRETILFLFNITEEDAQIIQGLKEEIQRLRDENNRLKGEQGKPKIRGGKKAEKGQKDEKGSKRTNKDISSEKERNKNNQGEGKKRGTKNDKIKIDREETCEVDKSTLPPDAEFKGYEKVTVQDLIIITDNVLFLKEVYYSKSENKTYIAKVPEGYEGGYGPHIKALALILKNVCNMSEPKILSS